MGTIKIFFGVVGLLHLRGSFYLLQAGKTFGLAFSEHEPKEAKNEDKIEKAQCYGSHKIVRGHWLVIEDFSHPFKEVSGRQGPSDFLRPKREDGHGIKNGAEGGKEISDHPGERLDLMAPVNDGAAREKSEGPSENEEEDSGGEKIPAYFKDVDRIEEIDDSDSKAHCDEAFAERKPDCAEGPFSKSEWGGKEVDEVPMPKFLQQADRNIDRSAPGDAPKDQSGHQHQREVFFWMLGPDPDRGKAPKENVDEGPIE